MVQEDSVGLIRAYVRVSLVTRIIVGFLLGAAVGGFLWYLSVTTDSKELISHAMRYCSPFGTVFINMLKMIVVPIIFFSLVVGSSSLPLEKLGKAGGKIIGWYFATMFIAASIGVTLARLVNPGSGSSLSGWQQLATNFGSQATAISAGAHTTSVVEIFEKILLDFFQNPFNALANANFLGVIMFSILFGISLRVIVEKGKDSVVRKQVETVIHVFNGCNHAMFKIVDVVMNYSPVGVFFLSMVIFSVYGPAIIGPYVTVLLGVSAGIIGLIFIVYPLFLAILLRENPYKILGKVREAMIMAFVTRSSAATLPVSIKVTTENLGVHSELASFALPLGSTINMDGVCIHLPMFAILAANMFGIHLGFGDMVIMVITTVIAAMGTGGVPGGSLMLLFIILNAIGLDGSQTAVIVALALGINPILDMFETMSNVTGDLLCTYVVAKRENLLRNS
jgi:proton glutamate symport protein